MNRHLYLFVVGLVVLATSAPAVAGWSASAPINFRDCDCDIEGKLFLRVDNVERFDAAFDAYIAIYSCPSLINPCPPFPLNQPTGRDILTKTGDPLNSSQWGVAAVNNFWGDYAAYGRYCAKVDINFDLVDNEGPDEDLSAIESCGIDYTQACVGGP